MTLHWLLLPCLAAAVIAPLVGCRAAEPPMGSSRDPVAAYVRLMRTLLDAENGHTQQMPSPQKGQGVPIQQPVRTVLAREAIVREAVRAARRHNLPPDLVLAVIEAESSFRTHVQSSQGALGIMQVMPRTAVHVGIDPASLFDYRAGIEAGCRYLRLMIDRYGRLDLALAAYNWGPGNLESGRQMPRETSSYITKVRDAMPRFKAEVARMRNA